jgi:hypothetical protein
VAWIEEQLPADTRAVEVTSQGGVRLGDVRLVDAPGPGRRIAWLAGLAVVLLLWWRRAAPRPSSARLPARSWVR